MSFYREVSSLKQILCLSNEPWSTSPGRTQQLLSRLRDTQILYFAPPAGRRDRSFRQKGQKVRPNVTVYTLPPTLFPVSEQYSRLFLRNQMCIRDSVCAGHVPHLSPTLVVYIGILLHFTPPCLLV